MKHLDIDRIISALTATPTGKEEAHLQECAQCLGDLERWRQRLRTLRELESETLDPGEIHQLRVLFRHFGPARDRRSWIAQLVRRSEPTPATVPARGGLSTMFEEYRAGPWDLVIQVKPSGVGEDMYDVHGQLMSDAGGDLRGGDVLLTSDRGFGATCRLDGFGEFHLHHVPAGAYDATWLVGDACVELRELDIGDMDDSSGS